MMIPRVLSHTGNAGLGNFAAVPVFVLLLLALTAAHAAETRPSPATVKAWDRYLAWADQKVKREVADPKRFLIRDFLPQAEQAAVQRALESGAVYVDRIRGVVPREVKLEVPDGEIHHWWGAVLVPDIGMAQLMRFLQDYGNHAGRFSDVEKSRLIERQGNYFKFFFRLRRSKALVTVYYNSEQECDYHERSPDQIWSQSNATKIAELDAPGTPSEREKGPGEDRGFLWRLVSWWRFQQTPKGVIVECESASLSRDIPFIVKLIPGVAAYIRSTPKESLESILLAVRQHAKSAS